MANADTSARIVALLTPRSFLAPRCRFLDAALATIAVTIAITRFTRQKLREIIEQEEQEAEEERRASEGDSHKIIDAAELNNRL